MDALHLRDGHLVSLQLVVRNAIVQNVKQEIVRDSILLGKSLRRNGRELRTIPAIDGVLLRAGCQRVVIQLCVIPVVSPGSLALGRSPHVIFVLLLEQSVLGGKTRCHRLGPLRSKMNDREPRVLALGHRRAKHALYAQTGEAKGRKRFR